MAFLPPVAAAVLQGGQDDRLPAEDGDAAVDGGEEDDGRGEGHRTGGRGGGARPEDQGTRRLKKVHNGPKMFQTPVVEM